MMPLLLFTLKSATKDTFEWLEGNPKLLPTLGIVNQLFGDIVKYKVYLFNLKSFYLLINL